MTVNIIVFGPLTEIIGSEKLSVSDIPDTENLTDHLVKTYPALSGAKYVLAVDKKIIKENTQLKNDSSVALLPPFSGG